MTRDGKVAWRLVTYLAPVTSLAGSCVRLELALDDRGKVLGRPFQTREFRLGRARGAVQGRVYAVAGPLWRTSRRHTYFFRLYSKNK